MEKNSKLESKPKDVETSEWGNSVYDIRALKEFAETIPVETVTVESLKDAVSEGNKYWLDESQQMFRPAEMLQDWEKAQENPLWQDHVQTIQRANLDNPIWLAPDGVVFDGIHRLTRAVLEGVKEIKVRKFKYIPESAIISQKTKEVKE